MKRALFVGLLVFIFFGGCRQEVQIPSPSPSKSVVTSPKVIPTPSKSVAVVPRRGVWELPNGRIDWDNGILYVIGKGLPPGNIKNPGQRKLLARRAAIVNAQRNILFILKQIPPSEIPGSGKITLSGIVKGAQILEEKYLLDGSCQVKMKLNFHETDFG